MSVKERNLQIKGRGGGLHKLFKIVIKELNHSLPALGESGSEVSHFIPEPRIFAEVTRLLSEVKKSWIKATLKGIKNLIGNNIFLVEEPIKGGPLNPCMYVYKEKPNVMEVLTILISGFC